MCVTRPEKNVDSKNADSGRKLECQKRREEKKKNEEGEREKKSLQRRASFHLIADNFHEVKCEEETADSGWKFECQIKF